MKDHPLIVERQLLVNQLSSFRGNVGKKLFSYWQDAFV
jgi:hypothetical protein